jgi:aminopeptidase YwaD
MQIARNSSLALALVLGIFAWLPPIALAQTPDTSRQGGASYGGEILPSQARRVIAPLLPYSTLDTITNELSGELTMQHIEVMSLFHRTEPSREFNQSAEYVERKLKEFGLADAHIERFPGDGKIMYSTFRTRPQWDVEFSELWMQQPSKERLGSYAETALSIAQYSRSANVTAEVIDVGSGTADSDYAGKDVAGKIVLAEGDTNTVHRKAVYEHGAAGVIDYRLNLIPTTRQQDMLGLVTQGVIWPLDPEYEQKATFACMISPRKGRQLHAMLQAGEKIVVHADIKTRVGPGEYQVVTATIPGTDKKAEEFVLSCHLGHPRPGANDNVSGCAAILEIARALTRSISTGALPRPRRSIRFMFPPENLGTIMYEVAHPEAKQQQVAAMQLDSVGGNPTITSSILHLFRTPYSMATYLNDVAQNLFQFVSDTNIEKIPYRVAFPHQFEPRITSVTGTRDNFWGSVDEFFDGSDSFIYSDSSVGVPAVYLEDWPDPYFHTSGDLPANLDPTKLRRSAVIAATVAYAVANADEKDAVRFANETANRARERTAALERDSFDRLFLCSADQFANCYMTVANSLDQAYQREAQAIASVRRLAEDAAAVQPILQHLREELLKERPASRARLDTYSHWLAGVKRVATSSPEPTKEEKDAAGKFPRRNRSLIGPMDSFAFDYLTTKLDSHYRQRYDIFNLPVNSYAFETAYEALNFADGTRSVLEIAKALQAEFGDVPLKAVDQYLELLASNGVVEWVKPTASGH